MMPPTMPFLRLMLALCGAALIAGPGHGMTTAKPEGSVLLQRFLRSVGGETAIRSIRSLSASGTIQLPGTPDPGTFQWAVADGGRCVFEMKFPSLGSSRFGSNGTIGWETISLGDSTQSTILDSSDVDRRRRRANWFELALTLPARAVSFDTIGTTNFDGATAWEVRMEDATGRVQHLFFDAESSLLSGVRLIERGPLGPADITIRFEEWKPVGPLRLFHRVTIDHANVHMKMHFEKVSLAPIPDAAFLPPAGLLASPAEPPTSDHE